MSSVRFDGGSDRFQLDLSGRVGRVPFQKVTDAKAGEPRRSTAIRVAIRAGKEQGHIARLPKYDTGESTMTTATTQNANFVSESEWLGAREKLLEMEKQLTRQRDVVSAARRALPWVRVEKEYGFETAQGRKTLADLFDGRSQLIIYSFMWRHDLGNGCIGCTFLGDHVDGANQHLKHHDVSFVAVSRAPLNDLLTYKKRMGWQFELVSSLESDFNFDYHVSFTSEELASGEVYYNYRKTKASLPDLQGQHVFCKSGENEIFHTYSCYARANEEVVGAYMWLDLTPKGRNENGPYFSLADWVRPHDLYDQHGMTDSMGGYHAEAAGEPACRCHETHT